MSIFKFEKFELDLNKCQLFKSGIPVDMEPQVYCLLELLTKRHGDIVSREEIIDTVWDGRLVSSSAVDSRIKSLRFALDDNGKDQRMIKTYPNRGYRLICELENICLKEASLKEASLKETGKTNIGEMNLSPLEQVKYFFNFLSFSNKVKTLPKRLYSLTFFIPISIIAIYFFNSEGSFFERGDQKQAPAQFASDDEIKVPDKNTKTITWLPARIIDANASQPYLAEILDGQMRRAITAIQGISVVSISPDTKLMRDTQTTEQLAALLEVDYAISNTLITHSDLIHLDVELVRTKDQVVLWSNRYTTKADATSGSISSWPANSAISATIAIANKLGLSINERASYLLPYKFQEKVAQARIMIAKDEYQDLSEAIELLQQAIDDEPDYLPAYESLYHAYWRRLSFVGNDFKDDSKQMLDLTASMEWISPDAPETILVKAASSLMGTQGTSKSGSGENVTYEWDRLIKQATVKDPNNSIARSMRAYFMQNEGQHTFGKIVSAHEDALYFNPTDPSVLADYSRTRLCQGQIDEAQKLAESNISWNPNHRKALDSIAKIAHATADYKTALYTINTIIEKGWMQHDQTKTLRSLYFDLGAPERILKQVRFSPAKAQVFAMSGNKPEALAHAKKMPNFYTAQIAMLVTDPKTNFTQYNVNPHYLEVQGTSNGFYANACSLNYLSIDAFALQHSEPKRSKALIGLLEKYYSKRSLSSLKTSEEYLGLMSLHTLKGNQNMALKVMDAASNKGYVFISRFKEPVLQQLTSNPGFPARIKKMQARANKILSDFDTNIG